MTFLRNLRLAHKFGLIGLLMLAMTAPPTVDLILKKRDELQTVQHEADGIRPVGDVLKTLRLTQVHRGISTNWLSGNDSLKDQREARAVELDKALAALSQSSAQYAGGRLAERRRAVETGWVFCRPAVVISGGVTDLVSQQ